MYHIGQSCLFNTLWPLNLYELFKMPLFTFWNLKTIMSMQSLCTKCAIRLSYCFTSVVSGHFPRHSIRADYTGISTVKMANLEKMQLHITNNCIMGNWWFALNPAKTNSAWMWRLVLSPSQMFFTSPHECSWMQTYLS